MKLKKYVAFAIFVLAVLIPALSEPAAAQSPLNIQLRRGWNLITLPIGSEISSISQSDCEFIGPFYGYNNTNHEYTINSFIRPKEGFWAYIDNDCSITVRDTITPEQFLSNGILLKKGWNFIGGSPENIEFSKIKGTCSYKRGPYLYNTLKNEWEIADIMKPGEGYIVGVTQDCMFVNLGFNSMLSNLKYFGYYASDYGYPPNNCSPDCMSEIYDHANIAWIGWEENTDVLIGKIIKARQNGLKVVISVGKIFYENSRGTEALLTNYQQRWNDFVIAINPYINDIAAFHAFDEPTDADLMKRRLETEAAMVKGSFPSIPIAIIFAGDTFITYPDFEIPRGFDWIGFDYYGELGGNTVGGREITWYLNATNNKLNADQKMIIIPDAMLFSGMPNDEPYVTYLNDRINIYLQYAYSNPAVIGIFPYTWWSSSTPGYEGIGARDIPEIKNKFIQTGAIIKAAYRDYPTNDII